MRPHVLSMREVAERAGLAEQTVRAYRSRGQMPEPDVMIGTTPGWLADTIDAWIEGGKKRPSPNLPGWADGYQITAGTVHYMCERCGVLIATSEESRRLHTMWHKASE